MRLVGTERRESVAEAGAVTDAGRHGDVKTMFEQTGAGAATQPADAGLKLPPAAAGGADMPHRQVERDAHPFERLPLSQFKASLAGSPGVGLLPAREKRRAHPLDDRPHRREIDRHLVSEDAPACRRAAHPRAVAHPQGVRHPVVRHRIGTIGVGSNPVKMRGTPVWCTIPLDRFDEPRTDTTMDYSIQSEARAGHWVAWLTAPGTSTPVGSVIVPGQTQDEAEANVRQWMERISADPRLLPPAPAPAAAGEENDTPDA